jgi:hypothetical protein
MFAAGNFRYPQARRNSKSSGKVPVDGVSFNLFDEVSDLPSGK